MSEVSPETAHQPMYVPHAGPEVRLTLNKGCEDETEWVRSDVFEAAQQVAWDLRRTLAMAHMYLSFRDLASAHHRIKSDTGLTIGDARALRGIVDAVLSGEQSTPPGQPTPPTAEADTSAGGL